MKSRVKKIAILVVGWVFILLGIAGMFLPVLQGILFLLIGLIILSSEYVWAHKVLTRLRTRFPKFAEYADAAHQRADRFLARFRGKQAPEGD